MIRFSTSPLIPDYSNHFRHHQCMVAVNRVLLDRRFGDCYDKGDLSVDSGTASFGGMVTAKNGVTIADGDVLITVGHETISAGDLTLTAG